MVWTLLKIDIDRNGLQPIQALLITPDNVITSLMITEHKLSCKDRGHFKYIS